MKISFRSQLQGKNVEGRKDGNTVVLGSKRNWFIRKNQFGPDGRCDAFSCNEDPRQAVAVFPNAAGPWSTTAPVALEDDESSSCTVRGTYFTTPRFCECQPQVILFAGPNYFSDFAYCRSFIPCFADSAEQPNSRGRGGKSISAVMNDHWVDAIFTQHLSEVLSDTHLRVFEH